MSVVKYQLSILKYIGNAPSSSIASDTAHAYGLPHCCLMQELD